MRFTTVVLDQQTIFGSKIGKAKLWVEGGGRECLRLVSIVSSFSVLCHQRLQNPKVAKVEYVWEHVPSILFYLWDEKSKERVTPKLRTPALWIVTTHLFKCFTTITQLWNWRHERVKWSKVKMSHSNGINKHKHKVGHPGSTQTSRKSAMDA